MEIRKLSKSELQNALPLIWDVFSEYEAAHCPEGGKQAFWDAIHSEAYLDTLQAYGAWEGRALLGVIATRNAGNHVALFFVDGKHHQKGIGRSLWNAVLAESTAETITVHSSLFAVPIYGKLGFVQTAAMQEENGIRYVPMQYERRLCTGR